MRWCYQKLTSFNGLLLILLTWYIRNRDSLLVLTQRRKDAGGLYFQESAELYFLLIGALRDEISGRYSQFHLFIGEQRGSKDS
ncbi:hypothetical protein K7X08_023419 [Anisodus acutangulus]|uniref:Uncharacterized protein n=1 Tax=Anisodus acutangulus TaxID=402998 RepID=A0A9Q1LIN4_9SOLA|nr:hypothetical protein K7X08_023419 [Anisodus acutangulus]